MQFLLRSCYRRCRCNYYADGRCEIDFLIQNGTEIIPVEVKSGENKNAASFRLYINNRKPLTAIRYSKRGYVTDGSITNLPLYLAEVTKALI